MGSQEVHERLCPGQAINSTTEIKKNASMESDTEFVAGIRWPDLMVQIFLHAGCLYGFYLIFAAAKWYTTIWGEASWKNLLSLLVLINV